MWDTVQETSEKTETLRRLSRDLPCLSCGHAAHRYLACDAACECRPVALPGAPTPSS